MGNLYTNEGDDMARWMVTISGKGVRRDGVDKLVESLRSKYGEGVSVVVTNAKLPETRAERFAEAINHVGDAKGIAEELRDELSEWKDNMPENLQDGEKAGEIDDAIGALEGMIDQLDEAEGTDVSFPSMM